MGRVKEISTNEKQVSLQQAGKRLVRGYLITMMPPNAVLAAPGENFDSSIRPLPANET